MSKKKTVEKGIRLTPTGKYEVSLYYGNENGKTHRAYEVFDTLKEAREKLESHKYEVKRGKKSLDTQITVSECILEFINERPIEDSTATGYLSRLKRISKYPLGKQKIIKVKRKDVESYLNHRLKEKELSITTINGDRQLLRSVFNFAKNREYYTGDNPVPEKNTKNPKAFIGTALSAEDTKVIFEYLDKESDLRLKTVVVLGILQGLRRGEIVGLRWEDIITIRGANYIEIKNTRVPKRKGGIVEKDPKTEHSARLIPLFDYTLETISAYRAQQEERGVLSEYIVLANKGTPIYPTQPNNMLSRFLKKCGLAHIRLHDCRHTCCTQAISNSGDIVKVSRFLGHSSTRVTEQIYTHLRRDITDSLRDVFNNIYSVNTPDNSTEFLEVTPLKESEN